MTNLVLPGIEQVDGIVLPPPAWRPKALCQWFTPEAVAKSLVACVDVRGRLVLEPSAGDGAIVQALLDAGAQGVMAVEIDPILCDRLRERFEGQPVAVVCADFLQVPLRVIRGFQVIVGNPPYDDGTDTEHLARIAELLCGLPQFPAPRAALLLRTVALHGSERWERVWSRVSVAALYPVVERVAFGAEAGKIDVSQFLVGPRDTTGAYVEHVTFKES